MTYPVPSEVPAADHPSRVPALTTAPEVVASEVLKHLNFADNPRITDRDRKTRAATLARAASWLKSNTDAVTAAVESVSFGGNADARTIDPRPVFYTADDGTIHPVPPEYDVWALIGRHMAEAHLFDAEYEREARSVRRIKRGAVGFMGMSALFAVGGLAVGVDPALVGASAAMPIVLWPMGGSLGALAASFTTAAFEYRHREIKLITGYADVAHVLASACLRTGYLTEEDIPEELIWKDDTSPPNRGRAPIDLSVSDPIPASSPIFRTESSAPATPSVPSSSSAPSHAARVESVREALRTLDAEWLEYTLDLDAFFLMKPTLRDMSIPAVRAYQEALSDLRDVCEESLDSDASLARAERIADTALDAWNVANDKALAVGVSDRTPVERAALRRVRGLMAQLEDETTPKVMWGTLSDAIGRELEKLLTVPVSPVSMRAIADHVPAIATRMTLELT